MIYICIYIYHITLTLSWLPLYLNWFLLLGIKICADWCFRKRLVCLKMGYTLLDGHLPSGKLTVSY